MGLFDGVAATSVESAAVLPGDELLPRADVVMDRAFTVAATPDVVWPWLVQLGKWRAGWYLPHAVERLVPPSHRAIWHLDPQWLGLSVGDSIPDYGGKHETFTVAQMKAPHHLVHTSRRGHTDVTWAIVLTPYGEQATRVQLRLRLHPVRRRWLATSLGDAFDALTIAGMAAGLRERV
jgi:hypothetical protein